MKISPNLDDRFLSLTLKNDSMRDRGAFFELSPHKSIRHYNEVVFIVKPPSSSKHNALQTHVKSSRSTSK